MIRCYFEDRIELEKGELVRIVTARWNCKSHGSGSIDVFKQYDSGKELVRNLVYSRLGGYLLYDVNPEEWDELRIECNALKKIFSTVIKKDECEMVKSVHQGFRWFLDKIVASRNGNPTITTVWEFLQSWKLWPECERLFNGGFEKLCKSTSFATMPYLRQQKIAEWLKQHPGTDYSLGKIQVMMNRGVSSDEYDMMKHRVPIDMIRYFSSQVKKGVFQNIWSARSIYYDYIRTAKDLNHNVADDYWKFPNDLNAAHDKVMAEKARKDAAKSRKKWKKYMDVVKKWLPKKLEYNGMQVYVPRTYEEINRHAVELHQCLIYADYIGRVSTGECLLVFIKRGQTPLATAEVLRNGKLGQFYGNELDRLNCNPGEQETEALNAWMKKFKPRLTKIRNAA